MMINELFCQESTREIHNIFVQIMTKMIRCCGWEIEMAHSQLNPSIGWTTGVGSIQFPWWGKCGIARFMNEK